MSESQTAITNVHLTPKKISIWERSILVGDIIAVNGYRVNRGALKQRFAEGGYQVKETPHFLLFTRREVPRTVIVHWFAPKEIDADLGDSVMQELKPLGLLTQPRHFSDVFGALVGSLCPVDVQHAWHTYGTNTLRRYDHLLLNPSHTSMPHATMDSFAQIYRRVLALQVGASLLDVGCSFGFLPLLVAEHLPSLSRVLGVDLQSSPFPVMRALAEERCLEHVHFVQGDVLDERFPFLGTFDTVTALHVLEHFSERDMYRALANLLQVTARRLILAVPYEEGEPETVYGHEQLFSPTKLEGVGRWCLQRLGGSGRMLCEECAGGLLLIERAVLFHMVQWNSEPRNHQPNMRSTS